MVGGRFGVGGLAAVVADCNIRFKPVYGIFYHDTQVRIRTVCFDSKLFADKIDV